MSEYKIKFLWDPEASVWIATSDDVPGLVLESGSFYLLVERVRYAVPELLEMNGIAQSEVPLYIVSERYERAYACQSSGVHHASYPLDTMPVIHL